MTHRGLNPTGRCAVCPAPPYTPGPRVSQTGDPRAVHGCRLQFALGLLRPPRRARAPARGRRAAAVAAPRRRLRTAHPRGGPYCRAQARRGRRGQLPRPRSAPDGDWSSACSSRQEPGRTRREQFPAAAGSLSSMRTRTSTAIPTRNARRDPGSPWIPAGARLMISSPAARSTPALGRCARGRRRAALPLRGVIRPAANGYRLSPRPRPPHPRLRRRGFRRAHSRTGDGLLATGAGRRPPARETICLRDPVEFCCAGGHYRRPRCATASSASPDIPERSRSLGESRTEPEGRHASVSASNELPRKHSPRLRTRAARGRKTPSRSAPPLSGEDMPPAATRKSSTSAT